MLTWPMAMEYIFTWFILHCCLSVSEYIYTYCIHTCTTYLNTMCIFDMAGINISFICDYDHSITTQCETQCSLHRNCSKEKNDSTNPLEITNLPRNDKNSGSYLHMKYTSYTIRIPLSVPMTKQVARHFRYPLNQHNWIQKKNLAMNAWMRIWYLLGKKGEDILFF